MRLPPDSLAFQMLAAAAAVRGVNEGSALPQAIEDAATLYRLDRLERAQAAAARGALQDLAYRTMRQFGTARALVTRMVSRPPGALVDALLAVALTLLIEAEEGNEEGAGGEGGKSGYSAFTVVDQAVSATASDPKAAHARGMVNAVLRRFLRERRALLDDVRRDDEARWNLPDWWLRRLRQAYPDRLQQLARHAGTRPPMTLRVNPLRIPVQDYLQQLAAAGIAAERVGEQAVRLTRPLPVAQIPGFEAGDVSVQDAGAQLAGPLLGLADGQRVLDACAAPGGKTGHLLELAEPLSGVEVVAVESDAVRARRIDENLSRLGKEAQVLVGDASRPADWWDGRQFDRILADVPCSASGIVRRHPDIRWLRRETDLARLVNEQRRIVSQLWPLLKPGGILVYVTCSIFPTEGEEQAQWFGEQLPDAIRLQAPGQLLPCSMNGAGTAPAGAGPSSMQPAPVGADSVGQSGAHGGTPASLALPTDHDGFFYARFQKRH
ncbi:16S rRNA (cytosine(967)-C(5))-methyltransferase RsmB [Cupriavidus sp. AU9028]|uniref:16S rRNA (cytosine(967)-C(5))-methyltransferase RsmB n=1 Tax=Cupriavidus sp. AU9028 TaxID=2871157 RepID=UPI001C938217|nr:16S rRNA (cytosine(967)-C(5))-methyltransferase RsmB [Cupriavidus sp. AU9028]MBY4897706.1 16S rRNA (cytosine(967)-C(5))-methyltransferase RsmB [Cupriavidus sp. AU9028]